MRIIFIGAVEFSRRSLDQLFAIDADIVGVCTLEKSVFNADHYDLSLLCEKNNVPWIYTEEIHSESSLCWIRDKQPDVIFCFGWSKLLKEPLLSIPPLGVIGFHPAALPANRGRHPLIWALVLGLEKTASSFFFMDSGADSGDILSQREIHIGPEDDATTLYDKVAVCALEQIREFVPQLASGHFPRLKQDTVLANNWRKRCQADSKVDWRMSAQSIHNLVRGLTKPYIGAHFLRAKQEIKIWKTMIVIEDVPKNFEPGKVISYLVSAPIIKCGENAICLLSTSPDFKPVVGEYL